MSSGGAEGVSVNEFSGWVGVQEEGIGFASVFGGGEFGQGGVVSLADVVEFDGLTGCEVYGGVAGADPGDVGIVVCQPVDSADEAVVGAKAPFLEVEALIVGGFFGGADKG